MNYKFATIKKWQDEITVIDIPPQNRIISFVSKARFSGNDFTKNIFLSLPRMHFFSFLCGADSSRGELEEHRSYCHSIVFVDNNNYFYPALSNIRIRDLVICGLGGYKDKLANIEIALKNLDRFYSTSFTSDLPECLDRYIAKDHNSFKSKFSDSDRLAFLRNWSRFGKNYIFPMIPLSVAAKLIYDFKDDLEFKKL